MDALNIFNEAHARVMAQAPIMVNRMTDTTVEIPNFGLSTRTMWSNPHYGDYSYDADLITRPAGSAQIYGITTDNKVLMVLQFKHGVGEPSLEFPPGGIGRFDFRPYFSTDPVTHHGAESRFIEQAMDQFTRETGYGLTSEVVITNPYNYCETQKLERGGEWPVLIAFGLRKIGEPVEVPRDVTELLELTHHQVHSLVFDRQKVREQHAIVCAAMAFNHLKRYGIWSPELDMFLVLVVEYWQYALGPPSHVDLQTMRAQIYAAAECIRIGSVRRDEIMEKVKREIEAELSANMA